jgi:hypothetical protein
LKWVAEAGIVDNLCPQFGLFAILGYGLKARRYRFYSLFLLMFLGIVSINAIARADVQNAPVTSVGLGPQFAIADFDGDHIPDLAIIQTGLRSSGTTNYWIQLKFSRLEWQYIRFVAPAGGLFIEARDVNGDHVIDLVVATLSFRQPVAIFLNNGDSSFSRVDPAAFPGAFSESAANWAPASDQQRDAVGIPMQSRTSLFSEALDLLHRKFPTGTISLWSSGFLVDSFLISHAGRAPPSEVPRS